MSKRKVSYEDLGPGYKKPIPKNEYALKAYRKTNRRSRIQEDNYNSPDAGEIKEKMKPQVQAFYNTYSTFVVLAFFTPLNRLMLIIIESTDGVNQPEHKHAGGKEMKVDEKNPEKTIRRICTHELGLAISASLRMQKVLSTWVPEDHPELSGTDRQHMHFYFSLIPYDAFKEGVLKGEVSRRVKVVEFGNACAVGLKPKHLLAVIAAHYSLKAGRIKVREEDRMLMKDYFNNFDPNPFTYFKEPQPDDRSYFPRDGKETEYLQALKRRNVVMEPTLV